jgi:hypothetical protein
MSKFLTLVIVFINFQINAQNVGINTPSPSYPLTVLKEGVGIVHTNSTGNVLIATKTNFSGFSGWFGTATSVPMHFGANNANALTILPDGKVGIAQTNPADLLHINGTARSNGLNIMANGVLELGVGIAGKEVNAGKIGYSIFSPMSLDIIGAGTPTLARKIRLWAEGGTTFEGPVNTATLQSFSGLNTDAVTVDAFTRHGSNAPAIKNVIFYNTTASAFNNNIFINHNLNWLQIVGVQVLIWNNSSGNIFANNEYVVTNITPSQIQIYIKSPASGLLNMPCKVFVTYQSDTNW